jgi:oligopeptide/dipeptide ABC transporter ATP-binding protein
VSIDTSTGRPVFEVDNLQVRFRTGEGVARAVNGISFTVHPGERVAIVGESGCGKSASLLASLRLLPDPPAQTSGRVLLDGRDLFQLSRGELNEVLGRDVGMVFQDSLSSLNPVLRMGRQIYEGVRKHEGLSKKQARAYAVELLQRVGVPDPGQRVDQYPHQLSGGMRQRAMIAMALAGKPKLLIADEPTTALDVTVQAQILDLVRNLVDVAIVWVSHDLGVVAGLADRVLVMYAGYIIEEGDVRQVFHRPRHPYTQGLLKSVPTFRNANRTPLAAIPGLPPNLTDLPPGCPFYARCEVRETKCLSQLPPLMPVDDGQRAACWVTAGRAEVAG